MDRNKLALLTNELGGYDEVERVIGVDAALVQRAVEGERLSGLETAEIDNGFAQLYLHPEIAEENFIDTTTLFDDGITQLVNDVDHAFYDVHRSNQFRTALADRRINPDDLETAELLFKDGYNTPNIQEKLLGWLNEDRYDEHSFNRWINRGDGRGRDKYYKWLNSQSSGVDYNDFLSIKRIRSSYDKWFGEGNRTAKDFLERFAADGYTLQPDEDSAFWKWFREQFY